MKKTYLLIAVFFAVLLLLIYEEVPCPTNNNQYKFLKMLEGWQKLAKELSFTWWIYYGSLLGAIRNGKVTPWDHDMDVCLMAEHEQVLRAIAWPNTTLEDRLGISIHTRLGEYCPEEYSSRKRLDCRGHVVDEQIDACGFCGSLARLFLRDDFSSFMDIYKCVFEPKTGELIGDGHKSVVPTEMLTREDIFPLAWQPFMGLNVPAPRNASKLLLTVYGFNYTKPNFLCDPATKRWIKQF